MSKYKEAIAIIDKAKAEETKSAWKTACYKLLGLMPKPTKNTTKNVATRLSDEQRWPTCVEAWWKGQAMPSVKRPRKKDAAGYLRFDVRFSDGKVIRSGTFDRWKDGTPDVDGVARFARALRMEHECEAAGIEHSWVSTPDGWRLVRCTSIPRIVSVENVDEAVSEAA